MRPPQRRRATAPPPLPAPRARWGARLLPALLLLAPDAALAAPEAFAAVADTWPTGGAGGPGAQLLGEVSGELPAHGPGRPSAAAPASGAAAGAAEGAAAPATAGGAAGGAAPAAAGAAAGGAAPGTAGAAVPERTQRAAPDAAWEAGAPAHHGLVPRILPRRIHGFALAGNREASLRVINGGRRCVDARGLEPPGWQFNGTSLDLATCAAIASRQPNVVGFRWGRQGFNHSAYVRSARPSSLGLAAAPPGTPVDLEQLFGGEGTFKCDVYMVDGSGKAPSLDVSDIRLPDGTEARRLSRHVGHHHHHQTFRFMEHHKLGRPQRIHENGGEVCLQRRSLLRFYDFETTEMWFCYMPEERWAGCAGRIQDFYLEGLLPMLGALLLIFGLAYIMQNQPQFSWALSWVAAFCVNLELGVASVAFLLNLGADSKLNTFAFEAIALVLVVAGATMAMLPYRCQGVQSSLPTLVTWYLLALVVLPCISLDLMSYWNTFPLLVDHWPIMLGLLGFAVDTLRSCLLDEASETTGVLSARSGFKVSPGDYEYQGMRMTEEALPS